MIEHIDSSLIDWSRAQFALTAIYHWIFVPLTLGLAVVMGLMETFYYRTGDLFWKRTARFWIHSDATSNVRWIFPSFPRKAFKPSNDSCP